MLESRVVTLRNTKVVRSERDTSREAMRQSILDIAAMRFSEQGYRATNLNDVAQELAITRQALYHYFPRKVDILIALNERMINKLDSMVVDVAANHDGVRPLLYDLLHAHIRVVAQNTTLVTVFAREGPSMPDPERSELRALRLGYRDRFVDAYRRGIEREELVDVDPLVGANVLLGAANNLIQWYPALRLADHDAIADTVCALLAGGFLATAS
jgi:AcrR family transcriptional regulator